MAISKINDELETLYQSFYDNSINSIKSRNHSIDTFIDRSIDNRRGLSLVIRLDEEVRINIEKFTDELRKIDPTQYYQPISDLHVTVLSIISCHDGFTIDQINVDKYIEAISTSLKDIQDIQICFKGVTTTKEAVMIQGFMLNDNLTTLRDRLRENFRSSTLMQDIDTRYLTKTAHITSVRFRERIRNAEDFVKTIEEYKVDFGITRAANIDLIYTDWYCRKSKVKWLNRFALGKDSS